MSSDLAQVRGVPVSPVGLVPLYVRDLARSAARMLLRQVRTRDRVAAEYHEGHWRRVLEQQPWLEAPDLSAFLAGTDRATRVAKVAGRVVRIPTDAYYRLRLHALSDAMSRHAGDDELVELGCGFGYNLFSLALSRRWRQLRGFDVSEHGTEAGSAIAAHFGLADRVSFGLIDLTDTEHPNYAAVRDKTLFTYCCIEQLPGAVESVLATLLKHRPRRVIHIEPTTELLSPWRPLDLLNYAYVKSVDYQTSLFTTLERLESRGSIRILARERMPWAPTIHNDTFLVAWEPRQASQ